MTTPGPLEYAQVPTSIGTFRIVYRGHSVRSVDLLERGLRIPPVPEGATERSGPFPSESPPRQLSEYFRGKRSTFNFELDEEATSAFDRDVYRALLQVPAGQTVTYGELARRSGHPGTARAVGGAMARNPIPILVPCHRVVGSQGSLTGFGLGLWRKRWLLDREGAWPLRSGTPGGPRDPHQLTLGPSVDGTHSDGLRPSAVRRHGPPGGPARPTRGERASL